MRLNFFLFLSGLCAALSLCFQLGCLEISAACLKMYFEGNPPANQFLCRAYLCQGQLKSPPATGSVVRTVNWTHPLKGVVCVCVCVFLRPRDIYTCNYCSGILYSFALKTCSSFANKLQRFYHASSVSNKYWPLLHLSAA